MKRSRCRAQTPGGFPKTGQLRRRFQEECLWDLRQRLRARGHELTVCRWAGGASGRVSRLGAYEAGLPAAAAALRAAGGRFLWLWRCLGP